MRRVDQQTIAQRPGTRCRRSLQLGARCSEALDAVQLTVAPGPGLRRASCDASMLHPYNPSAGEDEWAGGEGHGRRDYQRCVGLCLQRMWWKVPRVMAGEMPVQEYRNSQVRGGHASLRRETA